MSKMSESQRQYFLQRVSDQIHSAKRVLELKESRKKEQMIEKMYPKYLKTIGIQSLLNEFNKQEKLYNKKKDELFKVVERMCEAEEISTYRIDSYAEVVSKLKQLCALTVDREYKNTEDGKDLLALDTAHQQARDMIWSAGSQSEHLMKAISATLSGANIDLGYKPLQIESK